ncbi:MAG: hypothetical protein HY692_00450, partial [Cyanobacteria bacterium NC_groundwater_1444_Ag_S-0.65um_54_12]|nr:hypothetical protein [Cyanobacteria bacterium NC_groundwater_1444_Ag_S-0.65um_54_12]
AIYGWVVDSNDQPLPGAEISDGTAYAMSGDGEKVLAVDRSGERAIKLRKGDFILDRLPVGWVTLRATFDEVSNARRAYVAAGSTFDARKQRPSYGATALSLTDSASPAVIIKLPFSLPVAGATESLRIVSVTPATLRAQFIPSNNSLGKTLDFQETGSRVSCALRATPNGSGGKIRRAIVKYLDETGNPIQDRDGQDIEVQRQFVPAAIILPADGINSGPLRPVEVDLATNRIATDSLPVVFAKLTFMIEDPTVRDNERPAKDAQKQELSVTIPITVSSTASTPTQPLPAP